MHRPDATSDQIGDYRRESFVHWQAAAPGWARERHVVARATLPMTDWLIEHLAPKRGQTVLELAAGAGATGFRIAERLGPRGHLISSDRSPRMVAAAQRAADELGLENVECRIIDAEAIALPDASVDGVICQLGLMLVGDPALALREIRRILRPRGRLCFVVWAEARRNPWAAPLSEALLERGLAQPPQPGMPGLFALADGARLRTLLEEAGFSEVLVEDIPITWRYVDFDELWRVATALNGGLQRRLPELPEPEVQALREAVRARAEAFAGEMGYALPGTALGVAAG